MKVTSALLTTMSGKIGGAVASTSRGGVQYFRKLVIPSNPRTTLQTAIRAAVTSAAGRWRSVLTDEQRETWWDAATGGQTGGTLYAKVNQPRIYAVNSSRVESVIDPVTISPRDTPPESFATTIGDVTTVIDDSSNTLTITVPNATDDWLTGGMVEIADTDPAILYVYASHQQQSSRLSRQHPYQLVAAIGYSEASATPAVINLAPLGFTTTSGEVMYVKTVAQRPDGALSTPIERRITIVA